MKKLDPTTLKADWSRFEHRSTFCFVTSRELAMVLGVHLQTINNWTIRGVLPPAEKHRELVGNKNHYRIGAIQGWLTGRTEEEVHMEWARKHIGTSVTCAYDALFYLRQHWKAYGIKKPLYWRFS